MDASAASAIAGRSRASRFVYMVPHSTECRTHRLASDGYPPAGPRGWVSMSGPRERPCCSKDVQMDPVPRPPRYTPCNLAVNFLPVKVLGGTFHAGVLAVESAQTLTELRAEHRD